MNHSPKIHHRNLAILLEYDRLIKDLWETGKVKYKKQIKFIVAKKFGVKPQVVGNILCERRKDNERN